MEIYSNSWVFQNTDATGNGNAFVSGRNDQITLYITGSSVSRTIHIEGSDNDGNWFAIPAVKLPELTITSSTTGNNEVYVVNTTNFVSIRCRISAISGGTVKITGRVVDSGINLIKSVSSLPSGTNLIGKVGIDQTTPGTTNKVVASITGILPYETLVEQLTQLDAVAGVLTFSENIVCIEIYNTDASNAGTFNVNGIDIVVPASKVFKAIIGGTTGATVTVSGSTTYIVSRYE